jgi:squalene-associated FAD-dependent desaturase
MPRPDVIVVGAGFAGLSAAVRLIDNGARVLVVEERRRLGGRATAFPDPKTGERVDNGQHAVFGCYHETFAFLRAIGADDAVRLDDRLDLEIIDQSGRRSRLRSTVLPPPFHLVGGLLGWRALGVADRIAALRLGLLLRRLRSRADVDADAANGLAHQTVVEWLVANGQTPRLREVLWEPLAVAALNQSPMVASAAPFVRVLTQMFSGTRRDAAIGLPSRSLDELYAVPSRRYLESHGGAIRMGAPATLVASERALGVEVRGELIEANAVISSVPWFDFAAFAGGVPALEAIAVGAAGMDASPIVTVNLWFDRRVTDAPFLGLPGRTFQWVFDKAQLLGDFASHLSLISSGADDVVALSNEELIDKARVELSDVLPAVSGADIVRATAVREKRATFSLAPGQPARPGPETPVRDLYLAGDWTATGLPATIEGAVVSGHRAADLVVRARP